MQQRRKVPKIDQQLSFQGLGAGDLLRHGVALYIGWRVTGIFSTFMPFQVVGAVAGFYLANMLLTPLIEKIPAGGANNFLGWLGKADVYLPLPDETIEPIVVHKEEAEIGQSDQVWLEGGSNREYPQGAAAS